MTECLFPGCSHPPNRVGMCLDHQRVRIASAWSPAGEDEGHRRGSEE